MKQEKTAHSISVKKRPIPHKVEIQDEKVERKLYCT